MSSHHDNFDNHSTEPKTVSFVTPMILGCVALLGIILLVNTCDKKHNHNGSESQHNGHDTSSAENHHTKVISEANVVAENEGTLDSLGNYIYNTGTIHQEFTDDGTEISFGESSTEAKLMDFLSKKEILVDTLDKTKGWLTLDRVYFEKGKSVLTNESQLQIKNLGMILKLYPTAKIKVGGYTDNSGVEATNVKLSSERGAIILNELVKYGIDGKRLKSVGYGSKHPIANNDSPQGMAQNRRVDIKVTEK